MTKGEPMSCKIELPQLGEQIVCAAGANLYQLLAEHGLLDAPCGGKGTCGKCAVIIDGQEQLSCTYQVQSDISVLLPQSSPLQNIISNGYSKDFVADSGEAGSYGIAIDIGTTTVVAALYDLATASELAALGCLNSQKAFGQDVISRINYAGEHHNGLANLQRLIVSDLSRLISGLLTQQQLDGSAIKMVSVAGNTTMIHLLGGIDPTGLGRAPYLPAFSGPLLLPAGALGLPLAEDCPVYCLPAVSAFVGGDITAGMVACDLAAQSGNILFIDIGTNGEMVLSAGGQLLCCSCAAGPALEGMNISCGMRAAAGAIEAVRFSGEQIICQTIGDSPAAGICGSGLLSLIAAGLNEGIIDSRGRLTAHPLVSGSGKEKKLKITEDIYLSQGDIRQVQLAKGAILSGALTLVEAAGLTVEQLDRVLVAGQFGLHLPAASLTGSTMLPRAWENKISYVGNTAKSGAAICLLSAAQRQQCEQISTDIEYIELSTLAGYEQLFIDCLGFVDKNN